MKKIKSLIAALLSVSIIVSGAAFAACGGDDGEGGGNTKPIDEQTWKAAFEELDYTNVSMRVNENQINQIVMISENAVYYKLQIGDEYLDEYYSVKNENGNYTNYMKMYHPGDDYDGSIEDAKFEFDSATGRDPDWVFKRAKEAITFTAPYEDNYNAFQYDENVQNYVCGGVIEVERTFYEDFGQYVQEDIDTYHFVDNIVKVSNDKIVSYSFRINWYSCVCHCVNQSDHNDAGSERDISVEYFNIGTTEVEVPQEVIDEASGNSPKWDYPEC